MHVHACSFPLRLILCLVLYSICNLSYSYQTWASLEACFDPWPVIEQPLSPSAMKAEDSLVLRTLCVGAHVCVCACMHISGAEKEKGN